MYRGSICFKLSRGNDYSMQGGQLLALVGVYEGEDTCVSKSDVYNGRSGLGVHPRMEYVRGSLQPTPLEVIQVYAYL